MVLTAVCVVSVRRGRLARGARLELRAFRLAVGALDDVNLRAVPQARRLVLGDGAAQRDSALAERVRLLPARAPPVGILAQLRDEARVQRLELALVLDVAVLVLEQRALRVDARRARQDMTEFLAQLLEPEERVRPPARTNGGRGERPEGAGLFVALFSAETFSP